MRLLLLLEYHHVMEAARAQVHQWTFSCKLGARERDLITFYCVRPCYDEVLITVRS